MRTDGDRIPLVEALLKKAQYYDFMIELLDKAEGVKSSDELIDLIAESCRQSKGEGSLKMAREEILRYQRRATSVSGNNVIKSFRQWVKSSSRGGTRLYYLMDVVRKI